MMVEVYVATPWRAEGGRNDMAVAEDYPGAWSDATGQPDAEIPPAPNAFVARGVITEAQLAALAADLRYTVLRVVGEADKALSVAEADDLKTKLRSRHGLTAAEAGALVKAGETREKMIGRAVTWCKGLKKQAGQIEP